jgi:hypothetical protein
MTQYRARGHYIPTDHDSWVTTVWRNTRKAAEEDIAAFVRADNYSQVWIESRGIN